MNSRNSIVRWVKLISILCVFGVGAGGPARALSPLKMTVSCAPQADNVLRYDCTVRTSRSARVRIQYFPWTGKIRRTRETFTGLVHRLTLWGMPPESTVPFTVYAQEALTLPSSGDSTSISGSITTGSLPAPLSDGTTLVERTAAVYDPLTVGLPGVPSGGTLLAPAYKVDYVLTNVPCGRGPGGSDVLVILNREGQIVWYQSVGSVGAGEVSGFQVTPGNTVLAILDHTSVAEWRLDGSLARLWSSLASPLSGSEPVFDKYLHHDVQLQGDHLMVLTAEERTLGGGRYVVDGLQEFDATGALVNELDVLDAGVDPSTRADCGSRSPGGYWGALMPKAVDALHANAFAVGPDSLFLSLRHCSEVLNLDPAGGALNYRISGASSSDLALDTADVFYGQHHLSLTPEGNLQLFDNQWSEALGIREDARVLELGLDTTSLPGTAMRVREQPLSLRCPGQGSAFILNPEGDPSERHLLVDCTSEGSVLEYDGGGRLVWEVDLSCPVSGSTISMYRAVPLESLD